MIPNIWLFPPARIALLPGAVLVVLGLFSVFARRPQTEGKIRTPGGVSMPSVSAALAECVSLGLALGLTCAVAYQVFQSQAGLGPRLLLPDDLLRVGMLGFGGGLLLGLALLRLRVVSQGMALGATFGVVLGLVAFRLIFGRTAGYGSEMGEGVGFEVALPFALAGGLGGALVGMLLRTRSSARSLRLTAIGGACGAGLGVAVAFIGWWYQLIDLRLPYVAQVPYVQTPESPMQTLLGVLYGLGIFGILAGLTGALAGAYVAQERASGTSSEWRMWLASGSLFAAFAACLFVGLQIGFGVLYLGGPVFGTPMSFPVPTSNPVEATLALAAGFALAILTCLGVSFAFWRSGQRSWGSVVWLALCSLTVLLLPLWFIPAFWIDIY